MTTPAINSISTGSNLDFCLDNFPPPRPPNSEIHSPLIGRKLMASTRPRSSSSVTPPRSQMSFPSGCRLGLPSNPRSPQSPRSLERGVRRFASPRPRSGLRGALSGIFQHKSEPDLLIPIQDVSPTASTAHEDINLHRWPPLHIEKRPIQCPESCCCTDPKRKKRRAWLLVLIIVLLLYLLANTIVLNVRMFSLPSRTRYGTDDEKFTLSHAQELCLTQFTVNAPSNASLYPCSTCLGLLQDIPASFRFATTDGAQTFSNSIQFCGLQSLVTASSGNARDLLTNGGWVQDTRFCTWTGVWCDSQGIVRSIEMVFPGVPSVIPPEISALSSLQSLQIIGGNSSPAGALPDSFTNLTSLTSLHLENTALSPLPPSLFAKGNIDGLTTLTLVRNTGFGGQLPDLSGLALKNLVIDNQPISAPLDGLLNSTALQDSLTTLSLNSANLTGSFPSPSSLSQPISFPSLQTLSLINNMGLTGPLPSSLCESAALESCDIQGTGLVSPSGGGDGCGVCIF